MFGLFGRTLIILQVLPSALTDWAMGSTTGLTEHSEGKEDGDMPFSAQEGAERSNEDENSGCGNCERS